MRLKGTNLRVDHVVTFALPLAAATVIGIGLVLPSIGSKPPSKASMTQQRLQVVQLAIETYLQDRGQLPSSLHDLQAESGPCYLAGRPPVDGWGGGVAYLPVPAGGHPYQLRSPGPDGQLNSADDFDVWARRAAE